jgi:tetratricopeptide (TPR) repeat protein
VVLGLIVGIIEGTLEALGVPSETMDIIDTIFMVLILWPNLAIQAKRWHDLDKSAWWICIFLIPIVGPVWAFIKLALKKGTEGDNRFGPDLLPLDKKKEKVHHEANAVNDMMALAGIYREQGKYVEAERLYKRALETAEKTVSHYKKIGEETEAEKLEAHAKEIRSLMVEMETTKAS